MPDDRFQQRAGRRRRRSLFLSPLFFIAALQIPAYGLEKLAVQVVDQESSAAQSLVGGELRNCLIEGRDGVARSPRLEHQLETLDRVRPLVERDRNQVVDVVGKSVLGVDALERLGYRLRVANGPQVHPGLGDVIFGKKR